MNVLMITHEKYLNGASRSMLNLLDVLGSRHKFYIVSPFKNGPVMDELLKRNLQVFHHRTFRWVRSKPDSGLKWAFERPVLVLLNHLCNVYGCFLLKREIKDLKIDVIHTNTSVINIGGCLNVLTGIPHVWYIREFGQEDMNNFPIVSQKRFYKTIDAQSNVVIAVSKAVSYKYKQHIKRAKLLTIYNGVGKENYIVRHYDKKTKYSFLIAGMIKTGKGQNIAVRAVSELISRGVCNFRLYIAGSGDTSFLQDMFEAYGDYIVYLGQVSNMHELRKKMDVELVCSRCEAFGRVTAEAMMSGMPVIGSNSGGTPELIRDGVTGFLYTYGDYIELADKMQYYLKNPDEIKRMGENAQEYSCGHFMIERCASEVEKAYQYAKSHYGQK